MQDTVILVDGVSIPADDLSQLAHAYDWNMCMQVDRWVGLLFL